MKKIEEIAPLCSGEETHGEVISAVKDKLPCDEELYSLSDFFKVFGDPTRLNILCALEERAMCGCDLSALLGMSKAAVSYQLKMLRQNDLVRYKKQGKNVIYELSDGHVRAIIECALDHIRE